MPRLLPTILLCLALLAGCSRSTVLTLEVDALAMMDTSRFSGTLALDEPELYLPGAEGLSSGDLGLTPDAFRDLEGIEAHFVASLQLAGTDGEEEVTLSLHIAAGRDASPFDADPVAIRTATLAAGEPTDFPFDLVIDEQVNAAALAILRSGEFSIGLVLARDVAGGASEISYELVELGLKLPAKMTGLLPF